MTETKTTHTPTQYEIFHSSYGWGVGKDNSDTEVFYFNEFSAALTKFLDLTGKTVGDIVCAVNSHDALKRVNGELVELLLEAAKSLENLSGTTQLRYRIREALSHASAISGEGK